MTKLGTIITNAGDSLINEHVLAGNSPFIADGWHMAVGTGEIEPAKTTTSLVNPVFDKNSEDYNGISFGTDAKYGRYAEISLPESVEGVVIREVGLFDENDVLIAVASTNISLTETISNGILNSFKSRISLLNVPNDILILYTPQGDLLTEEILRAELENYVKKDGSTPFWAEQKGVDPTSPTGLTTLQKVQALIANFADKTFSNITLATALNNLGFLGQSLSANGYYKLPNGLIIQWGNFTLSGGYYVDKTVIFPISFTSQIFAINGGNYSASNTTFFCLKGKDLNQFVVRLEDKGGQGLGSVTCFWLAIGI